MIKNLLLILAIAPLLMNAMPQNQVDVYNDSLIDGHQEQIQMLPNIVPTNSTIRLY